MNQTMMNHPKRIPRMLWFSPKSLSFVRDGCHHQNTPRFRIGKEAAHELSICCVSFYDSILDEESWKLARSAGGWNLDKYPPRLFWSLVSFFPYSVLGVATLGPMAGHFWLRGSLNGSTYNNIFTWYIYIYIYIIYWYIYIYISYIDIYMWYIYIIYIWYIYIYIIIYVFTYTHIYICIYI